VALALSACASGPQPRPEHAAPPSAAAMPPLAADPRVLMVDAATAMLGQPYHWGGAAPGGFDCSGLVYFSASGAGIRVPRTAEEQLSSGIPITRDDVRAGDLVFMHLDRKGLHVGIAVSNERFIHAPSSGGRVRIDSLGSQPYAHAYLGARRIIAGR
jgi:cell wall-associated NlpC family hydrolase